MFNKYLLNKVTKGRGTEEKRQKVESTEKEEEPEIKLPTSIGSLKKQEKKKKKKEQESSRKASTSALLTAPQPLTLWVKTDCGKFLNRGEYQTILPASWEICMQVMQQQL